MILNDTEIRARIAAHQLLTDGEDGNVRNCGYTLRAARVFRPQTAQEYVLGGQSAAGDVVWYIKPTETLVVMTRERVRVPEDLCATYAPLHRLAKKGIMLLNPAIVEPGYHGPLSCFLVNFSSERVALKPNEAVSKIFFHKLVGPPAALQPYVVEDAEYAAGLAESAARYHSSFLDVTGIEDRAAEKARQVMRTWVITGGVIVAFLLFWATLEPVLSRWIWERTGVSTTSHRLESVQLLRDLEAARAALEQGTLDAEFDRRVLELQREIAALRDEITRIARPPTEQRPPR